MHSPLTVDENLHPTILRPPVIRGVVGQRLTFTQPGGFHLVGGYPLTDQIGGHTLRPAQLQLVVVGIRANAVGMSLDHHLQHRAIDQTLTDAGQQLLGICRQLG